MKYFFFLLFSLSCIAGGKAPPHPVEKAYGCSFLVRLRDVANESPVTWMCTDFYNQHPKDWVNPGDWMPVDDGDHIGVDYSCRICQTGSLWACMDVQVCFRDGVSEYWQEYLYPGDNMGYWRVIYDCPNHVARLTPILRGCECDYYPAPSAPVEDPE